MKAASENSCSVGAVERLRKITAPQPEFPVRAAFVRKGVRLVLGQGRKRLCRELALVCHSGSQRARITAPQGRKSLAQRFSAG
jgi:hypothetical protein